MSAGCEPLSAAHAEWPEATILDFRHVWRHHRGMTLGFALAALLTLALGVRFGVHAVYWSRHHEVALAEWMTLGYVAQSWGVGREDLARALDVAPGTARKLTLAEIARASGRSEAEVEDTLRAAIAAAQVRPEAQP